jgi:hypothetical protein
MPKVLARQLIASYCLLGFCAVALAGHANEQLDARQPEEPTPTGNILQLRDSLLFTRRVSIDVGISSTSERVSVPNLILEGPITNYLATGFANSFSLGVRTPVSRVVNMGLATRWSELPSSTSRRFSRGALAVSRSFRTSPTDSLSIVGTYSLSRLDLNSNQVASSLGGSMSWFRSLDPVVIGVGIGHERRSSEVQIKGRRYRQGSSHSASATMAFAINDQMSLALTSAVTRTGAQTLAGVSTPPQSGVSTSFSFGYAPTKRDSFFVTSSMGNVGGASSLTLGATYTRRFF